MNAVFIHIPKTGGLTIERVLQLKRLRFPRRARQFKNEGIVTFGHIFYNRLREDGIINDEFHNNSFKFAFCRNPFDRAVSHYFYVQKAHPDILPNGISFLDYTRTIGNYYRKRKPVFEPQHIYTDKIELDFLGRFENLENDLKIVGNKLGIQVKTLPRINSTRHEPYQNYYCKESIDNIRQRYEKDFERFGYNDCLLH